MEVASASTPEHTVRQEWRAVSDVSFRCSGGVVQSEERTIYEEGAGQLEEDFRSITIDEVDTESLKQKLQSIAQQREELQNMEIELRAHAISQPRIAELERSFERQLKDHALTRNQLKEQLREREKYIVEMEMKLEEKERELHALKIDNAAAWAKEDILREQNKELASFRMERDNSEAERAQHIKQIHELQEHIREKESQLITVEEQNRIAQESIHYKDEQLREAHSWIAQVQELDALQSTTNQSLQAELRERTEHFNLYWMSFQQQYVEMERHHLQAIQQLQLELSEVREQNGIQRDGEWKSERRTSELKGSYIQENFGGMTKENLGHSSNMFVEGATKVDVSSGTQLVPTFQFIPTGGPVPLHPYMVHPQGICQPLTSSSSYVSQLDQKPMNRSQHFQNEQVSNGPLVPDQPNFQLSESDQSLLRPDVNYSDELPAQRQTSHAEIPNPQVDIRQRFDHVVNGPEVSTEIKSFVTTGQESNSISSSENSSLKFEHGDYQNDEKDGFNASGDQSKDLLFRQHYLPSNASSTTISKPTTSNGLSELPTKIVNYAEISRESAIMTDSALHRNSNDAALLDERSLLACIVRAIPAGPDGQIRISTTLTNRLGKMLVPLHWHDYMKRYGQLDDFVCHHPELFIVEGDYIRLREGAQQIISATTAVAKVAAAATAAPHSLLLPSVAVTPVAHSSRPKRMTVTEPFDGHSSHISNLDHQKNCFHVISPVTDLAASDGLKKFPAQVSFSSKLRPSPFHTPVANGGKFERISIPSSHEKGANHCLNGFGGEHLGRSPGAHYLSKR